MLYFLRYNIYPIVLTIRPVMMNWPLKDSVTASQPPIATVSGKLWYVVKELRGPTCMNFVYHPRNDVGQSLQNHDPRKPTV